MEIKHTIHPHKLIQEQAQIPYLCYGCKEMGLGSCYQCKKCNFYLHFECISPFSISHPFSKACEFTFLKEGSTKGKLCDACGRKVKGFRYKCCCSYIKRNLHPQCSKYQEKYEVNGWTLNLSKKISSICLHCEEKGSEVKGWGYVSSCGDYCFHVVCLWERLYDDWSKGLFTGINSCDVSEMVRLTIVKLVMKQGQLQRKKKVSGGGNVSRGDVISIANTVSSAVVNN